METLFIWKTKIFIDWLKISGVEFFFFFYQKPDIEDFFKLALELILRSKFASWKYHCISFHSFHSFQVWDEEKQDLVVVVFFLVFQEISPSKKKRSSWSTLKHKTKKLFKGSIILLEQFFLLKKRKVNWIELTMRI